LLFFLDRVGQPNYIINMKRETTRKAITDLCKLFKLFAEIS